MEKWAEKIVVLSLDLYSIINIHIIYKQDYTIYCLRKKVFLDRKCLPFEIPIKTSVGFPKLSNSLHSLAYYIITPFMS